MRRIYFTISNINHCWKRKHSCVTRTMNTFSIIYRKSVHVTHFASKLLVTWLCWKVAKNRQYIIIFISVCPIYIHGVHALYLHRCYHFITITKIIPHTSFDRYLKQLNRPFRKFVNIFDYLHQVKANVTPFGHLVCSTNPCARKKCVHQFLFKTNCKWPIQPVYCLTSCNGFRYLSDNFML